MEQTMFNQMNEER